MLAENHINVRYDSGMANRPPRLGAVARRAVPRAMAAVASRAYVAGLAAPVCVLCACAHRPAAAPPEPAIEPPPVAAEATRGAAAAAYREVQVGYASWYGRSFAGRRTASGERFDPSKMTAAHLTLRFGTWVEVTRVDTRRSVRVRITDRGPFGHADRIIDLSRAAAQRLGLLQAGLTKVEVRVVAGP